MYVFSQLKIILEIKNISWFEYQCLLTYSIMYKDKRGDVIYVDSNIHLGDTLLYHVLSYAPIADCVYGSGHVCPLIGLGSG